MKHSKWLIFGILLLTVTTSYFLSSRHNDGAGDAQRRSERVEDATRVLIRDDLNREVELDVPVERIVSGYSAFTIILEALQSVEVLTGATHKQAERIGVISVGRHVSPNVEAIVSARPQLVIVSANRPEVVESLQKHLKPAGIKILAIHPHTVTGTLKRIRELGVITGNEKKAEELITRAEKKLHKIDKLVDTTPVEKRPMVFMEVRSVPNLLTCGRDSIAYDVIRRAGGRPLYQQGGSVKTVSLEVVMDKEPDAYIQQHGPMNSEPVAPGEHPILQSLECVREERILEIEQNLISRPGPHIADTVERIHRFLY